MTAPRTTTSLPLPPLQVTLQCRQGRGWGLVQLPSPSGPDACNGAAAAPAACNGAKDVLCLPSLAAAAPAHHATKVLAQFSGCHSPPRQMCPDPPCRPSLLQAHQQRKSQSQQHPGPPLLHSSLPPLQFLLFQPLGCAEIATTLKSLCRLVE
jgi:hypothetical protein